MQPTDALAAVTHADPYPYYAKLRERALHFDESLGLWLAASAADVEALLNHPACRVRPGSERVPVALQRSSAGSLFSHLARMNDGAAHSAMKALLGVALEGSAEPLHRHAARSAQRLSAHWTETALPAALDHYLIAMPVYSLASLFDVPERDQPAVLHEVIALAAGLSPLATDAARAAANEAVDALRERFAARLREPGDGPLARLAQARLEPLAILDNAIGLLWQSFDASAGLIGNSLVQLARDATLRHRTSSDQRVLAELTAEVARFDAPIQNTRRFLAETATVNGTPLPAGACVLVLLASANHDGTANPEPQHLRLDRSARRSWTFGSGGHACPGARLAHAIAAAAVAECLGNLPEPVWQKLGAPRYRASLNARIPLFSNGGTNQ